MTKAVKWKWLAIALLLAVAAGGLVAHYGQDQKMALTAGIATLMAVLWMTEAVSIYLTALLPVVLFPLLGMVDMKVVAPLYMKDIIFLFIGAFLLAYGLERWNLHKRLALRIILATKSTPSLLLLGFMLSSYLLSMWILNTATVSMLLPAVLAVVGQLETARGKPSKLTQPFLLGLAYASSIGGMATLIGTAPNLVMQEFFNGNVGDPEITFASWMKFGVPISIVLFVACYFVLRLIYRNALKEQGLDLSHCRREYEALGKVKREEKILAVVFLTTVLLWFFRKDLQLGDFTIPGWSNLLPEPGYVKESTIAMIAAVALFFIPSSDGKTVLTWKEVQRLPLGILFLFGGGFALAHAFDVSGLADWMGKGLGASLNEHSAFVIIVVLCLFMTFFTELTSNTASTLLMMPILFAISSQVDMHPLLLYLPVTFSASCAFMLPVATPPNTIVFASERLTMRQMMRPGLILNLIGVLVVSVLTYALVMLTEGT